MKYSTEILYAFLIVCEKNLWLVVIKSICLKYTLIYTRTYQFRDEIGKIIMII